MIKIFLADDHALLRKGLAKLINEFEDCEVVGQANNGKEVINAFAEGSLPDVLMLDLNMPGMNGYETAEWVKANCPSVRILILTMYDADVAIVRLMKQGVCGIMKKDISDDELHKAIRQAYVNQHYYCPQITEHLAGFFYSEDTAAFTHDKGFLSEQEINFIKFSVTDLTYKEIAHSLSITPKALDNIRENLFAKLNIKTRQGLALYAVKQGMTAF